MTEAAPPGHPDAVEDGCTCPTIDNNHGEGSYKGGYIVRTDCPVHADDGREWLTAEVYEG